MVVLHGPDSRSYSGWGRVQGEQAGRKGRTVRCGSPAVDGGLMTKWQGEHARSNLVDEKEKEEEGKRQRIGSERAGDIPKASRYHVVAC